MKVETTKGGESPPLGILQLEMRANTTDTQLRENLRANKSKGYRELILIEPHDKVLAIVGSGPSLSKTWSGIPSDCDVMALNGAYGYLVGKGRSPEFFAMLDAREENLNFLGVIDPDTLFLMASQCHPAIVEAAAPNPVVLFHLHTPTTKLEIPNAEIYVGGGGTIGLTALALALSLGYRKVILYGFDSSHEGYVTHVRHQPQNENQALIEVWVQDRKYITTHAMAAQTMDFFPFLNAIRKEAPDFDVQLIGEGLLYDFVATNNNPSTRERELSKYQAAYAEDSYGMSKDRYDALDKLIEQFQASKYIEPQHYLDISTGRGETLDLARKHGFIFIEGTETVDALVNNSRHNMTKAVLPHIPFPDKAFDVVSLIEVIEHLVPDDILPTLDELTRLARKHILISAAVYEHWMGGVNLHPSAKPLEEWSALFKKQWGDRVYQVGFLGQSPVWRVDL